MAASDLIIFIDDDIVCCPDVFSRHVAAHMGQDPIVAARAIFRAPGTPASVLAYGDEHGTGNTIPPCGARGFEVAGRGLSDQ